MIAVDIVTALVIILCPNPDKMGYYVQDYEVNCDEYYTNDIINNPNKYMELIKNVKTE